MPYDFVIVGAGLFGAALARGLTDRHRKVLVVEKASHVGGMCYTERRRGIQVHVYGPHVFHTNDDTLWSWVNRFATFRPFMVRTKGISGGKVYTLPINLMTLHQLWGVVTPAEAKEKLDAVRVRIEHPRSIEEFALSHWGEEIYRKFIYGYTRKQWGRDPAQLPAAILKRLPIRLNYDDNYFSDRYQGLPEFGYTDMFERILRGIEVRLGCDFFDDRKALEKLGRVIYSGRVDRFFDYQFGPLEFRTCVFKHENREEGDVQGNPVIHWLDENVPHTRTIEHKHFGSTSAAGSILTLEEPTECGEREMPLYPINDDKNMKVFARYSALRTTTIFGGRLGSYRYRDMHQVIAEALALAEALA